MRWKVPVFVLSVLGLLGLAGWGVSLRLDSILEEHRREALAVEETFPVDVSPRPAILGPGEDGNVWELLLPAFAGLKELDEYDNINNFDAHGTTGDTPRLIDAAHRHLELCRRAACRGDRTWRGQVERRDLQSARAVRALSSKGLILWRGGRDAEAAEWMVAALTVGCDVSALMGSWELRAISETWVAADLRDLLSEQSLSPAQLEDLARRLSLLRPTRDAFVHELRRNSARSRLNVLEFNPWIRAEDSTTGESGQLSALVGWRDVWSERVARARILNSLRACELALERIPWEDPTAASQEAQRIIDSYQGRFVHGLLPYGGAFADREQKQLTMDLLDLAVECARFQALHGRLPKTWEEAGIARAILPRVALEGDRLVLMGAVEEVPREWPIGRRGGPK